MRLRIKKQNIPIYTFCIGIFIFPYIFRERFIGSLALINFFIYFGLIYGSQKKAIILPIKYKKSIINTVIWFFYVTVASFLLFSIKGNAWSTIRRFLLLFVYIFPSLIICAKIPNTNKIECYSDVWLKALQIVCRLMCLFWFVDKILGNTIQNLWANFYQSSILFSLIKSGRFISFYGHALENASFFLALLIWATLKKDEYNKRNPTYILDIFTSLFGIAICGSKSGLMLAILLLFLCNIGIKKAKYMIVILVLFFTLYILGVFDLIISRIMEGIASGDLTTARNSSLETLMSKGIIEFKMMEGHPFKYGDVAMVAALEYPFLQWSFLCGIIFTIVQYLMYFVKPGIEVLLSKKWTFFICLVILMAFYNGNNGIVSFNDDLLIYSINAWLIMQVAGKRDERKHEKN